jgi:hypothetical protein
MEDTSAYTEHLPFSNRDPSNMQKPGVHSHMLRYVFIPSLCIYQLSASFKEAHYSTWVQLPSAPVTFHNMVKTTYISKHQSGTKKP